MVHPRPRESQPNPHSPVASISKAAYNIHLSCCSTTQNHVWTYLINQIYIIITSLNIPTNGKSFTQQTCIMFLVSHLSSYPTFCNIFDLTASHQNAHRKRRFTKYCGQLKELRSRGKCRINGRAGKCKPERRDNLGDLGVDTRIILK